MENYESISSLNEQSSSMKVFSLFVVLSQVFGVLCVVMVALWMGVYHGGFEWAQGKYFNFHPLFMVLGLVFFYAEAILTYRVFRKSKKIILKIVHASLHALSLIFAAVGLKAVFNSHNLRDPPAQNLYTLHSWLGLITVILFGIQWLFGFSLFVLPFCSTAHRKMFMPLHVFFGVAIFVLSLASALMGTTENATGALGNRYEKYVPEALLVNFFGLILVAFGMCVVYLVVNPNYKRSNKAEDEMVQLTD